MSNNDKKIREQSARLIWDETIHELDRIWAVNSLLYSNYKDHAESIDGLLLDIGLKTYADGEHYKDIQSGPNAMRMDILSPHKEEEEKDNETDEESKS